MGLTGTSAAFQVCCICRVMITHAGGYAWLESSGPLRCGLNLMASPNPPSHTDVVYMKRRAQLLRKPAVIAVSACYLCACADPWITVGA